MLIHLASDTNLDLLVHLDVTSIHVYPGCHVDATGHRAGCHVGSPDFCYKQHAVLWMHVDIIFVLEPC